MVVTCFEDSQVHQVLKGRQLAREQIGALHMQNCKNAGFTKASALQQDQEVFTSRYKNHSLTRMKVESCPMAAYSTGMVPVSLLCSRRRYSSSSRMRML